MTKQKADDTERLTQDDIDRLIMLMCNRTRNHQDISRGVSVRGAIAFKEILQGFNQIGKKKTRDTIRKAALVALPSRISVKQGGYPSAVATVDAIAQEVLYGLKDLQPDSQLLEGMEPGFEDMLTTLENLHLSQMAMQESIQREESAIVSDQKDNAKGHSQSERFLQEENGNTGFSLEEVLKQFMEELDNKLAANEITEYIYDAEKHKFEEMLDALSVVNSQMSGKELADTVIELMDAQDSGWDKEISQERMYIYYHMNGQQKGIRLDIHKRGYYGLRVLIDSLARQQMLRTATPGKSFTLTVKALDTLLDRILPNNPRGGKLKNRIGWSKAPSDEQQHNLRRYSRGDTFRDISFRHTLKELAKQKKNLSDVQRRDFRVFMKQSREPQSDIILCIDTSGSMGFQQKLTYARLAAAGLSREVLRSRGRIGIVAFDDLGEMVLPLTDNRDGVFSYIAGLNVGGNTNVGNGMKCARRLLHDSPKCNRKQIVLITDGEPTAIEEEAFKLLSPSRGEDAAEKYAILETRKSLSSGIKTSVIHVTADREAGAVFVNTVAMLGKGKVHRLSGFDDLRMIIGQPG